MFPEGLADSSDVFPMYIGDDRTDEDACKVCISMHHSGCLVILQYVVWFDWNITETDVIIRGFCEFGSYGSFETISTLDEVGIGETGCCKL